METPHRHQEDRPRIAHSMLWYCTLAVAIGSAAGGNGVHNVTTTTTTIITPDWSSTNTTSCSTVPSVEADVMPYMAFQRDEYMQHLSDLNVDHVRLAPWAAFPRVTVPELYRPPTDCSKASKSNWNSTLLDRVIADFMNASAGTVKCAHSTLVHLLRCACVATDNGMLCNPTVDWVARSTPISVSSLMVVN